MIIVITIQKGWIKLNVSGPQKIYFKNFLRQFKWSKINFARKFIPAELFKYIRPKKNIVCFRFPTDPIKTCATQIYFLDFQKKKKK